MRCFALLCALCCALTGTAWSNGNTGLIYGRVLISGSDLPMCPITVTAESDRQPLQSTNTLSDGSFYFLSVSPGSVKVTVGRSVRYLTVDANLNNQDTYDNPIYLSRREFSRESSRQAQSMSRLCHSR
jgi:hypothetical protein